MRGLCALALTLAAALLLALAGAAGAEAQKKPKLTTAFGVAERQVTVKGTLGKGGPKRPPRKRWRAVLEEKQGKRWAARASTKLKTKKKAKRSRYALRWRAPEPKPRARLRVRIRAKKKTVVQSKARAIRFSSEGELEPAPRIDRIAPADIEALPSADSQVLVLKGAHDLKGGQFLTSPPSSKAPEGFLLRVVSSSVSKGKTRVEVRPGSLYEAVPNGEIALSLADLASATPLNADAEGFSRSLRQSPAGQVSVPVKKRFSCEHAAEMDLSGKIEGTLSPKLEIKWRKFLGLPTGVDRAQATVDSALSTTATAAITDATASCKLARVILAKPRYRTTVGVGLIRVPVVFEIPVYLSASGEAKGTISVQANASYSGTLGVGYQNDQAHAIESAQAQASVDHQVALEAKANARLGIEPSALAGWGNRQLGGLAATYAVDAGAGPSLTYVLGRNPPGKLCTVVAAEGKIALILPHRTIEEKRKLLDREVGCKTWGKGPLGTGTLEVEYTYEETYTHLGETYRVEDRRHLFFDVKAEELWDVGPSGSLRRAAVRFSGDLHITYSDGCADDRWTGFTKSERREIPEQHHDDASVHLIRNDDGTLGVYWSGVGSGEIQGTTTHVPKCIPNAETEVWEGEANSCQHWPCPHQTGWHGVGVFAHPFSFGDGLKAENGRVNGTRTDTRDAWCGPYEKQDQEGFTQHCRLTVTFDLPHQWASG